MKSLLLATAAIAFLPTAALANEAPAPADAMPADATPADAAPAVAADAAPVDDEQQIIVIGKSDGYLAENSQTATKTDTPLIDVPQSIAVVTRERLDDQAQQSIGDVLRYIPGTTVSQGEGHRDQIVMRGQNTTADFFLDGVRDDVQYYRGLYNIERVEILKGPFALIFGRGGSGGIINRVQKTPTSDGLKLGGSASVNTFGAWSVAADVNTPITDSSALRINGTYEAFNSNRDYYDGERYAVNPYLAFDLGQWKLGLSYEYMNDDRVIDRGVPSIATGAGKPNTPLTGYRDTFFGVPGVNRTGLEAHIAKARLDGELSENLNWSTTVLYGDYDKYYTNVYPSGAATSQNGTVTLGAYSVPTTRKNFIAQSNLVWDVDMGSVDNKILLGLEYGNQDTTSERRDGIFSNNKLNLTNIVYPTVTFGPLTRQTESNVKFFSAYAQDQISFGDHFDVVVGLRYDRFKIEGRDIFASRDFGRTDEKVSPRVGFIYKPQENVSFYTSYSQSFLPRSGEQFTTLSTVQENLKPEKFTNYEVGAKWDIKPGLNATFAVFQLDRTNATTPDPQDVTKTINVGGTRTKGVELALTGRILPGWQMSGGYTFQDGHLKGRDAVRLGSVPRNQVALWNRYDFSKSFGLGVGVIHQSSQYAALRTSPTTTKVPAYTRADAAIYFKATDKIDLQVNIENLLDEDYFVDSYNNNNITPGAPINARFTARVKF